MRRGVGVAAIKNKDLAQAKFRSKGSEIADGQLSQMAQQLDAFKGHLEVFAAKHRDDIKKSPEFRRHFQEMCAAIGVDPLASSKGFWSKLGVGDYYYELGVQVVEVAMATSHRNGGIMEMAELRRRIAQSGGKNRSDVSEDDLLQAMKRLRILGGGYTTIPVAGSYIVRAVPGELSLDHTAILQLAQEKAFVTEALLRQRLGWDETRSKLALEFMVKEGLAWIDEPCKAGGARDEPPSYWFPGLLQSAST